MALTPFNSHIIADTGISMGDEGKGRLVSELIDELKESTERPDPVAMVMKVNGGANSGHTVGGLKLNLLPAGVTDPSVGILAIGSGVVADPRKFLWEGLPLERQRYIIFERLAIDERTLVSDVSHRLLDLGWEYYRVQILGEAPRGSTGRGITPAYVDEVSQWQIFYTDFKGPKEVFAHKLTQRAQRACATLQYLCQVSEKEWNAFFEILTAAEILANRATIETDVLPISEFDFARFKGATPFTLDLQTLVDTYWEAGQRLVQQISDVRELTLKALAQKRYIIGEFGQSFWLDKRHGFPPNVTASHTFTPEIFQSAGIPLQPVHTIGCSKAYDTKVGTHLFITEIEKDHPLAARLQRLEFGVSTGRQRKVGWFDTVEKGDALRYGGFQDLVINKLDALNYGGNLKICTAYRAPDRTCYRHVPRDDTLRARLQPVYTELPGWEENIRAIRSFHDLPQNARRYVAFALKSIVQCASRQNDALPAYPNLRYIGVGPDPSQIIKDIPDTETLLEMV